jgi:hypothetical protein
MRKVLRLLLRVAMWVAFALFGLAMWAASGIQFPFSVPATEVTLQKPYADFVGRQYRVASEVSAYAWNDFPDRKNILAITLMSPPGVTNRFVSYVTPLKIGQQVRIVSAWRRLGLFGFDNYYVVLIPGAELPDGVDITMRVNSDGVPDPRVYDPIDR